MNHSIKASRYDVGIFGINAARFSTQLAADRSRRHCGNINRRDRDGVFPVLCDGLCQKSECDWMALVMRGVKLGASGSLGVLCIGISAKRWQRLPVPAWLPSTASFAVGFFVMNGLGEVFDGHYDNILPKAGGGFLAGTIAGLGVFWAQKNGFGRQAVRGVHPGKKTD